jgi:hypothetical protein
LIELGETIKEEEEEERKEEQQRELLEETMDLSEHEVAEEEGLITPSGLTSIPEGLETPDVIELRKDQRRTSGPSLPSDNESPKQLYRVLQPKEARDFKRLYFYMALFDIYFFNDKNFFYSQNFRALWALLIFMKWLDDLWTLWSFLSVPKNSLRLMKQRSKPAISMHSR